LVVRESQRHKTGERQADVALPILVERRRRAVPRVRVRLDDEPRARPEEITPVSRMPDQQLIDGGPVDSENALGMVERLLELPTAEAASGRSSSVRDGVVIGTPATRVTSLGGKRVLR